MQTGLAARGTHKFFDIFLRTPCTKYTRGSSTISLRLLRNGQRMTSNIFTFHRAHSFADSPKDGEREREKKLRLANATMDKIEHKFMDVQGLRTHVAEIGQGQSPMFTFLLDFIDQYTLRWPMASSYFDFPSPNVVLFLHGFPEFWYSWRHQMVAMAKAGFRAVAPDYRWYGLSDSPAEPEKASFADILMDLVAILDYLGISKVLFLLLFSLLWTTK